MTKTNSMFSYGRGSKPTYEAPKGDPFKTPMPTLWAVEEPHVVNHAIPAEIRATATNQGGNRKGPTTAQLGLFETKTAAIQYAQSLNRPLVIIEMTVIHKIIPVLPEVQAYEPPEAAATGTPEFSHKG